MRDIVLKNINELFDSYDLFSREESTIEKTKELIPDISEEEMRELLEYLKGFYDFCVVYGDKLAVDYKVPFLPHGDKAEREIKEYTALCREKFPEIDEEHIRELFSTVCWLANR